MMGTSLVVTPAHADCKTNEDATRLMHQADDLRASNLDGAIEKYKEAITLDPDNHRLISKLATAYMKKETWPEAVATLDLAIKLSPKNANYRYMRGWVLSREPMLRPGKLDETLLAQAERARADFDAALAIDPTHAMAHYDLAELLLRMRKPEREAIVHYTRAIELRPTDPAFFAGLADLYLRLDRVDEARQTLLEGLTFITEDGKRFTMLMLLARAEDMRNDHVAATRRFEDAKKACGACTNPGEHIVYFELGAAYATMKPPRKAEAASQLVSFSKLVCRGAAAQRYADQCAQAQALMASIGGSL